MENKAYIVVNEQQEREVLKRLEQERLIWLYSLKKPIAYKPSNYPNIVNFPYVLKVVGSNIVLGALDELRHYEIVYDGRKEEKMSDKYVVSQVFMNELEEWKEAYITDTLDEKYHYVSAGDLDTLPGMIKDWWIELNKPTETNNHLIAIIRWVNGEDVFEVEKHKKWIVRSKEADNKGNYMYGYIVPNERLKYMEMAYGKYPSAYFDTKEEAESWANSHQEVIEIEG